MTSPATKAPTDLAEWSLHCFCLRARSNPKSVIQLDNNGEVLFQLVDGATEDDLRKRGVEVNESQLSLLETYGLLKVDGEMLRTRFPVLGPDQVGPVREAVSDMAAQAMSDVIGRAAEILVTLEDRGTDRSAHAIVFGHALDGVIWDILRARGGLPDVDLTIDEPLWRGSFWAAYPGREGSAGTNEVVEGETTLVMVWDHSSADSLRGLATDPRLGQWLRSIDAESSVADPSGLVTGTSPVPVITYDDPVHAASLSLADALADVIPHGVACRALLERVGATVTVGDATVIVAHEVIWEVAVRLGQSGVIDHPAGNDPEGRFFVRVDS